MIAWTVWIDKEIERRVTEEMIAKMRAFYYSQDPATLETLQELAKLRETV